MITVTIGNEAREWPSVTPAWISEAIRKLREAGVEICVQVKIHCNGVNLNLATPACGGGGGGGREPNAEEFRIIQLWEKRHLNIGVVNTGEVISFLKQLEDILGAC